MYGRGVLNDCGWVSGSVEVVGRVCMGGGDVEWKGRAGSVVG